MMKGVGEGGRRKWDGEEEIERKGVREMIVKLGEGEERDDGKERRNKKAPLHKYLTINKLKKKTVETPTPKILKVKYASSEF